MADKSQDDGRRAQCDGSQDVRAMPGNAHKGDERRYTRKARNVTRRLDLRRLNHLTGLRGVGPIEEHDRGKRQCTRGKAAQKRPPLRYGSVKCVLFTHRCGLPHVCASLARVVSPWLVGL